MAASCGNGLLNKASPRRVRSLRRQTPAGAQLRIGQEGDFLDVGFQRIEHLRGGFRPGEFIDDGIARELAQRGEFAVVRIRREIFGAAQARHANGVEHAVVRLGIEQRAGGVEGAGAARQAGNEQLRIVVALLMARLAAHAGLPRHAAEDARRGKQEVAEIEQIGALAAGELGIEQLVRLIERLLVELGAGRQHAFLGEDGPRLGAGRGERKQRRERDRHHCAAGHRLTPPASAS